MSEGKLTMFGKTFNTVGSTDANLVLKTKGDLKIQWGGKFIDLIKNGKIASTNSNILKTASSSEEIDKDGIYLISSKNGNEVWISINGTKINITGDTGTTYVSFLTDQKEITSDQKYKALTNIGFYYDSLEQVQSSDIKAGIVFVSKENKLYTIKDGILSEYMLNNSSNESNLNKYFEEITIGDLRIYKQDDQMNISSPNLQFFVNDQLYIDLGNSIKTKVSLEMKDGTFLQSEKATEDYGFRLYKNQDRYVLDIDDINLRGDLNKLSHIEVTYSTLVELIEDQDLIPGKEYKIIDFQNSWEAYTEVIYEDVYEEGIITYKNVRPIIVKAKNKNTLELNGYFLDNPSWVLNYDYSINGEIQIIDSNSGLPTFSTEKGRITYLKDEYGNEANYDFKHLQFLIDENWYYTFSNESGEDMSLDGNYVNNSITIKDVMFANKSFTLSGTNKLAFVTNVSNNSFKNFEGQTIIKGIFDDNIVYSKWEGSTINSTITNCEFQGNVLNTTFDYPITDCKFKASINNTDIFTKAEFKNCQVNNSLLDSIEIPDSTLLDSLKSLESKQVVVVVRDTKQHLSITSDTLLSIPVGAILMWSGTEIPYGWAICDGTNGTPNLIGRFVKAVATADQIGDNSSELNENNELTLTQEHLPKHSHPHKEHTHSLDGNISGTTSSSGDLTGSLDYSNYNWGIEEVTKTFVTSVTGEGVTIESGTVDGVSNIKTQGGNATGGNHTHSVLLDTDEGVSLSSIKSQEEELVDSEWPNNPIKIEPRSYSLIFIMKL